MQFLILKKGDTLSSVSKIVGQNNMSSLLSENNLEWKPKVEQQWATKCNTLLASDPPEVTASRKAALLNNLVDSDDVFEKACLMDENEWKVFSAYQAFPDALRIPETIALPYSSRIIGASLGTVTPVAIGGGVTGGAGTSRSVTTASSRVEPVDAVTYNKVMQSLKTTGTIPPAIFNEVNTSPSLRIENPSRIRRREPHNYYHAYNIPWGKIQMYSTLLGDIAEFPVYPEPVSTSRSANYVAMPDTIYQYEPWVVYQSSGPREQTLSFHMHRDMWTGDHRDGNANKLIRFCEANTFARYNGASVIAPKVRFYIDGSLFVAGVLTNTSVDWNGPIGLDNWFLEFTLSLTIQEVSDMALNVDSVTRIGLKGM